MAQRASDAAHRCLERIGTRRTTIADNLREAAGKYELTEDERRRGGRGADRLPARARGQGRVEGLVFQEALQAAARTWELTNALKPRTTWPTRREHNWRARSASWRRRYSNWVAGHPCKGLMQTIESTFNAYKAPGHDDIWNPIDNIIAGVRYSIDRYRSLANVPGVAAVNSGGAYQGY